MNSALLTYEQDEQAGFYQTAIKILNEESPNVWLFDRQNLVASTQASSRTAVFGPGHIMWLNDAQAWEVVE